MLSRVRSVPATIGRIAGSLTPERSITAEQVGVAFCRACGTTFRLSRTRCSECGSHMIENYEHSDDRN